MDRCSCPALAIVASGLASSSVAAISGGERGLSVSGAVQGEDGDVVSPLANREGIDGGEQFRGEVFRVVACQRGDGLEQATVAVAFVCADRVGDAVGVEQDLVAG